MSSSSVSQSSPSSSSSTSLLLSSYPHLRVLEHVQAYSNGTDIANTAMRGCWWQLTKSRRNVRGVMMKVDTSYTADFVREELRSRYRLIDTTTTTTNTANTNNTTDEADLVDEPSTINESNNSSNSKEKTNKGPSDSGTHKVSVQQPQWKLHDVLDEPEKEELPLSESPPVTTTSVPFNNPTSETGLRHRKGTTTNSTSNSKDTAIDGGTSRPDNETWTIVQEKDLVEDDGVDDDDETLLLLKKDPVELLGGWFPPRDLKVAQQKARLALEKYIEIANEAATILTILNKHQHKKKVSQPDDPS